MHLIESEKNNELNPECMMEQTKHQYDLNAEIANKKYFLFYYSQLQAETGLTRSMRQFRYKKWHEIAVKLRDDCFEFNHKVTNSNAKIRLNDEEKDAIKWMTLTPDEVRANGKVELGINEDLTVGLGFSGKEMLSEFQRQYEDYLERKKISDKRFVARREFLKNWMRVFAKYRNKFTSFHSRDLSLDENEIRKAIRNDIEQKFATKTVELNEKYVMETARYVAVNCENPSGPECEILKIWINSSRHGLFYVFFSFVFNFFCTIIDDRVSNDA